jgi:hypothetical protein
MQAPTQTWNLAGHFCAGTLPFAAIPSVAPSNARRTFWRGKRVLQDGGADFFGSDLPKVHLRIQIARYDWSRQWDHFAADMVFVKPAARLATELKTSPEWEMLFDDGKIFQANLSRMQELDRRTDRRSQ